MNNEYGISKHEWVLAIQNAAEWFCDSEEMRWNIIHEQFKLFSMTLKQLSISADME